VKTRVPYKVFSKRIINASLGVNIGLQSVNITLLSRIIFYYAAALLIVFLN